MKSIHRILIYAFMLGNLTVFAQYGQQKKADNLFNKFSFVNATEVYKGLIENNFNTDYAVRQLADAYAFMRNPDSASVYYKKAVEQSNVPIEYYFKYAQALRGVKDYKESRIWLKKFKDVGGDVDKKLLKNADFVSSVLNAKQQYFLEDVKFNSKYSDFGAYVNNGTTYFTSSRDEGVSTKHIYGWNKEPFLDIYVKTDSDNDSIVNHKSKLKGDVNSVYHDGPLAITNDGKTMFFSRNNYDKNGIEKDKEGISNLKIFKATLKDGEWVDVEPLPFNSSDFSTAHPALNSDNSKLYFASDMPGGIGGTDIYYVDINNDLTFGDPVNLGDVVNTNRNEVFPYINNEGALFFSSDGHQGLGLLDVFVTLSDENKSISSVLNLGVPVNSNKDDFSFFMKEDGVSGYFASNRDGGVGSDDIYAYKRILPLKVEGTLTDAINGKPIVNATVTLLDANGAPIASLQTDENGHYEINIDRDTDYKLTAKQDKYNKYSLAFTSKNIPETTRSITNDFSLNPVEDVIKLAELNTIYFDFEKYTIRDDAGAELDKIVNLMINEYPKMIIRIESHTDSRGTKVFNDWLSQARAKATYKYIVEKGVEASRITEYEGFGEQHLINSCNGKIHCEEEEHQLNRRTEFIVIKMQ